MQVIFKSGFFSVTAETKEENESLFKLANNNVVTEPKQQKGVRGNGKGQCHRLGKKMPISICEVEGCGQQVKNMGIHMTQRHGVTKSGEIVDSYVHNRAGLVSVKKPVVRLPDGTYRLRKNGGLLA